MSMVTSQPRREQGPQGPQDVSEVSTLVSNQSTSPGQDMWVPALAG